MPLHVSALDFPKRDSFIFMARGIKIFIKAFRRYRKAKQQDNEVIPSTRKDHEESLTN